MTAWARRSGTGYVSAVSLRDAPTLRWMLLAMAASAAASVARAQDTDPYLGIPIGGGPVAVGATPSGLTSVDAESCGVCHESHYREWQSSVHRTAYTNPVFVAEYGRRHRAFCRRCHAPRAVAASDGIDCAVCHVRDGAILNPTVSGRAPHRSREAPALGQPFACARCHEFEFENQPGELLQRTLTEWTRSPASERGATCQSCHMPGAPGHHRHDAPGSRDPEMLARALSVDARARSGDSQTTLTLRLEVDGAGHAVPTGDMFRRLQIRAWPIERPGDVATAWLRRRFSVDRRGWHETSDTRIPARGRREVVLELGPAREVGWSIDLWLLPQSEADQASIPNREARRTMASGRVLVE